MIDINDIRQEYINLINEDNEANRDGALRIKDNLEHSSLYYDNRITSYTVQIPRIYTEREIEDFKNIAAITYNIFDKVIKEYVKCAEYRSLFPFSKELEELILTPCGYDTSVPIARFDIFYNEETRDFYFCEINTDGSAGMNEDRGQDELNIDNPAHQAMIRRYNFSTFELFDSWVNTFIDIYNSYDNRVDNPSIAIVDFLEHTSFRELQEFARHFQRAGFRCEICDIRKLRYTGGKLYSESGNEVNAIYRRAITVDIMKHIDEVSDFISAVRNNACFIAGSLKTQIVHHKHLFHTLHLPRTLEFLTEDEQSFIKKHVPATVPFNEKYISIDEVINNRKKYIIKPSDDYGSSGVFAGVELTRDEWERKIREVYGGDFICQEYAPQYATQNIDFAFGDGKWHDYITMAGLYVYGGKFAGVFSRAALSGGIIASYRNERTQPTYFVTENALI